MSKVIHNYDELIKAMGCESSEQLERAMFEDTACGMPIHDTGTGVMLTGYVENDSDYCGQDETIEYPFTIEQFNEVVQRLEERAEYEWKWLNEDLHELGMTDEDIALIRTTFGWSLTGA